MPYYFMRDTPLQALEQLMMSQPGQKPRGGGIYRSPFRYTPEDVACEYCQNYVGKHPCRLCECTCLEERIEAGVLELNAFMRDCFTPSMGPQFRKRMHQQFRERKPQFFQFFLSDAHRRRWTHWRERCWRLSDRNKAALFLLTAFYKLQRYSYNGSGDSYGVGSCDIRRFFRDLWECSHRLKDAVLENKDFESIITARNDPQTVVYCDPPYYEAECYAVCAIQPGKTYTLSAYVRTTGMSGTGDGAQLLLKLKSSGATVASSRSISSNSNWTRLEVTYTHPENATSDSLVVHLSNRSVGTAYFDCVQLEESANASRYNIMENGDFRTGKWDTWSVFGWRFGDDCTSSETKVTAPGSSAAPQMDRSSMRFVGGTSLNKQAYQNILISGSAGDVYALGCWAKGDSVPLTSGTSRRFGIVLRFYYSDGTEGEEVASFNPDCNSQNDWQYLSLRAVAKKAYTSMRILMVYESNANVVYYDGIQLYKEEFGHSYVYDADGNVISVTDLQKQTTTYEYKNNDLVKMILPSGAKQTYTYDSYHNVLSATSPEGVVSNFTYDAYGNNTKVTLGSDAKKISAAATYTTNGNQLASVKDTRGNTTSYGYDAQTGLLNWVQAPGETESTRTNYSYDDQLRSSGIKQGSSQIGYTYSGELMSAVSTASGTEYLFGYTTFDALSSVKIGQRTLVSYTYSKDANHWLTRSDYGNGDYVTYDYDKFGRLVRTGYEDKADAISYSYDSNGNLGLRLDNLSGRNSKYFYDFQDRLMRYEETGDDYSNTVQWGYDDKNNLSSQTQILNGTTYTSKYTYDDDNRVTNTTEGETSATYTYDNYGRVTSIQAKNGSSQILNTAITYRDEGTSSTSPQVQTWNNGKTTYTYWYDSKGNISGISDGSRTLDYSYNSSGQLSRIDEEDEEVRWLYTYYAGGNLKQKILVDRSEDRTYQTVLATYSYGDGEWKDLLTAYNGKAITYDTIGNPLTDGTWTYTWQHGRQLAAMSKTSSSISFSYNADGKRFSKTVDGTNYYYTYLGDQLVEMTWDSNKMHFTYDCMGPLSVIYNGIEYFYLKNAQGDIVGIVNATGKQVVGYSYDPWGKLEYVTGSESKTVGKYNPFRYRSYIYDTETELYYLNSRYYNPVWGRFINADGYASTGQGITGYNMFSYCNDNPISLCDSEGTVPLRNTMTMMTDGGGLIPAYKKVDRTITNLLTDSNIYGTIVNGLDMVREGMSYSCVKGVSNAVRPANIGAGIFAKQCEAELQLIKSTSEKMRGALSKLAYGAVAIDVGIGIYDNIQANAPVKKIVTDAAVDTAFTAGTVWVSAKIGAAVGTAIGGPVGTLIGIGFGWAVGTAIYAVTDMWRYKGKTARRWAKDYANAW